MRAIEGTTVQVGVKWVEAHTTQMHRLSMTSEQKFVLKGNDEADEMAKEGKIECGAEKGSVCCSCGENKQIICLWKNLKDVEDSVEE